MRLKPQLLAKALLNSAQLQGSGCQTAERRPRGAGSGTAAYWCTVVRSAQVLVRGDGSSPGQAAGRRWPGAVGGSCPCSPWRESRRGPERPPTAGQGAVGPQGWWAPRLERLEMGKIHSTETETIKGAEETHKEV